MAQRQVHTGEDDSERTRNRSIASRGSWSRKRAQRMNMDRAIMTKAQKRIHSMQAPSEINASGGGDVPEVAAQPTDHAASS